MHEAVRRDEGADTKVHVATAEVGARAPGFEHAERPRGDVPGAELALPVAVIRAVGDEAQIERRGAAPPHAAALHGERAELPHVVVAVGVVVVRKPRRQKRARERAGSADPARDAVAGDASAARGDVLHAERGRDDGPGGSA